MKIDTTINIKKEVLERINAAALEHSVSKSLLVSLLLKRVMREKYTDKNRFSRVKYQKRDKNAVWKRPHIMLEYDLYEKCIDMKKLKKMSVSFLVSVAFSSYFNEVLKDLRNGDNDDNNLRHYFCIGKMYGPVLSYTVFWDFPGEENLIRCLE